MTFREVFDDVWIILEDVKDPEIPAVSVVEMGMVRSIGVTGKRVIVTFTPTFAGCPALQVIQDGITDTLHKSGYTDVEIKMSIAPAWSSNWISPEGREKLKSFGLAPPPRHSGDIETAFNQAAECPYCRSKETELKNDFGSTLCRAIYKCKSCNQPFERFKPI